uniref:GAG-pre-integrase domain-containing protein n=1 Tax=Solanum lycopersicum TaxID=4081 RepID=A0A3Q7I2A2_SOLLC
MMRICSGALVVMKAIQRNNNMYQYQGSTIIGIAATTSYDEKEAEMTKLWHMRLGHAGGKSLKTLLDQGLLKEYMHNPGKDHWQAVKWIIQYIHNTVDVSLVFEQKDSQYLVGYCDSDYAGNLDKRRSTTGYVFTIANAPVSWKSTLQSTVALSTTEEEYMVITEAANEAI